MSPQTPTKPELVEQASWEAMAPDWAWKPFEPTQVEAWDLAKVAHLYRRAAFGGTWDELQAGIALGPAAAVERLLRGGEFATSFDDESRQLAAVLVETGNREELAAWWLHGLHRSPHPLRERLTLFWHGHFATSNDKVRRDRWMLRQNETLRRHALGSFADMLVDVAHDPAMLVWLDSASNRRGAPNENFAREVMELFCLGIGNYTERDIQQGARALTGWEVRGERFYFDRAKHDPGNKTIFGQSGRYTGDDLLRLLLDHPATARFLVGKLFRALVSETSEPPASLITPLADEFRQRHYDLGWLVGTILRSNAFYSSPARLARVKSPVELGVGLARALNLRVNYYRLATDLGSLGQALFYPPSVKGWDGGVTWLSAYTMVGRANLVANLTHGEGGYPAQDAFEGLACLAGTVSPAQRVERLLDLMLGGAALPDAVRVQLVAWAGDDRPGGPRTTLARVVQAIASLPEYQLA